MHPTYNFIAVVDCTLHGVPGAFMSTIGAQFLKEIVIERKIFEPNEILNRLDIEVKTFLKQDKNKNRDGMDISLFRLEKINEKDTKIVFAGAKHSFYYYKPEFEAEKIERIKGMRRSIGSLSSSRNKEEFTNNEIILSENDIFYLMTDGFIDQNNKKHKRLGSKNYAFSDL